MLPLHRDRLLYYKLVLNIFVIVTNEELYYKHKLHSTYGEYGLPMLNRKMTGNKRWLGTYVRFFIDQRICISLHTLYLIGSYYFYF